LGNAIKEGVPVAIAGAPNVGKSTLLNRLLGEERAMVSEIAGTTRDVIEECANIGGVLFRFLDTAGIRTTDDHLERMGIERTMASIRRARIVIRLTDATAPEPPEQFALRPDQTLLRVVNKLDLRPDAPLPEGAVGLSARSGEGIDRLCRALREAVDTSALYHGDTAHLEQPPLRGAHPSLRSPLPRHRRARRGPADRPAERGDPSGDPPPRLDYRRRHFRPRSALAHLFEFLHR